MSGLLICAAGMYVCAALLLMTRGAVARWIATAGLALIAVALWLAYAAGGV